MVKTITRGVATIAVGALLVASQPASANAVTARNGTVGTLRNCGYHEDGSNAYYDHCDPVTHVKVYVDINWRTGPLVNDYTFCADPGKHDLGYAWAVDGAWYTGELC